MQWKGTGALACRQCQYVLNVFIRPIIFLSDSDRREHLAQKKYITFKTGFYYR
jgi:hypothetical protein